MRLMMSWPGEPCKPERVLVLASSNPADRYSKWLQTPQPWHVNKIKECR